MSVKVGYCHNFGFVIIYTLFGVKIVLAIHICVKQDNKGRWWPALGMFWGAKITATFFGQFKFLDNFDFWTILIFGQFWFLDNFYFWTILIFGQFWFFDNFDFWTILIFWKFWFSENLDFWTILNFGRFWSLDNFDI